MDDGLVDFGKGVVTPYKNLLEEILALTHDHAEALGCLQEAGFAREILRRGTSAHRQLEVFSQACYDGTDKQEALKRVVDWLIAESVPPKRSEEHTSELQSLMRISYAVFCLKKKKNNTT